MKIYLALFLTLVSQSLLSQTGQECAVNAGADQTLCYDQPIILTAEFSEDHQIPLDAEWTSITNPAFTFSNPFGYTTEVLSGPNWTPGSYVFEFCVACKDLNGNGTNDRVCDQIVVHIMPDVVQPVIIEPDGIQDGAFTACSEAFLTVTEPASPDEWAIVTISPDDGLVKATISGNTLHLERLDTYSNLQGNCEYQITYFITNGGCSRKASVTALFVKPEDPNGDGIIEGKINKCPSCTNTLKFFGDRPGCGATGIWTVVEKPQGANVYFSGVVPSEGLATATVSLPGNYTFQYTVTGNEPCPNSVFQISCIVLDVGSSFSLGGDINQVFCQDTLPAGVYEYTFNSLPNAFYEWELVGATPDEIGIDHDHLNTATVTVYEDLVLANRFISIVVTATIFYLDPDCDGPAPPVGIPFSTQDPGNFQNFIDSLMQDTVACIFQCSTEASINYYGGVHIQAWDAQFLCSDGTEFVNLFDYFNVISKGPYSANVNVLSQPGSDLPAQPYLFDLLELNVEGCGAFVFEVTAWPATQSTCVAIDTFTIIIEEAKPVTAGTDQVKCCNEPIRLNGNTPYTCGAKGLWSLVSCSNGCSVSFSDPTDPNTQLLLDGDCSNLPATLLLEWSFKSEGDSCYPSDTTQVYIDSCFIPCEHLDLDVMYECVEEQIILTAIDGNGFILNPFIYDIYWSGSFPPQSGNPLILPDPGSPVNYSVEATWAVSGVDSCILSQSGIASCSDTLICGIRLIESCDPCGNITVTAVDESGQPVTPFPYLHTFRWVVYGGPNDLSGIAYNNVNPITVHAGGCYSLVYEHFEYPAGAEPIPGTWTNICRYESPIYCVSENCPGPCESFPDFFIAGCGDVLDLSLGLEFPPGCHTVCGSSFTSATLGVFFTGSNQPVDPAAFDILWEDGSTGSYAQGILGSINSVRITSKQSPCCYWEDAYTPTCCDQVPQSLQCEQPIIKYCHDDGSVTYVPGAPQIAWFPVAGAIGYELEIVFGDPQGCCEASGAPQFILVDNSPWTIPENWNCFTIRVRAVFPPNVCGESNWSAPYLYCENVIACSPVIIVCGCCKGSGGGEGAKIPVQEIPEAEILERLEASPGQEYLTLRDALAAVGLGTSIEPLFDIYPNPANHSITIQPVGPVSGIMQVQLFDLLNRRRLSLPFEGPAGLLFNVSELPKGVYVLTILDSKGERLQTQKIILVE